MHNEEKRGKDWNEGRKKGKKRDSCLDPLQTEASVSRTQLLQYISFGILICTTPVERQRWKLRVLYTNICPATKFRTAEIMARRNVKLPACGGQQRRYIIWKHFHCCDTEQQPAGGHHSLTCCSTELCPSSSWRQLPVTRGLSETLNQVMVSAACFIFDLRTLIFSHDYWYIDQMFYGGWQVSPAQKNWFETAHKLSVHDNSCQSVR
jgi:hypothetical protein